MSRGPERSLALPTAAVALGAVAARSYLISRRGRDEAAMTAATNELLQEQKLADAATIARLRRREQAHTVMTGLQRNRIAELRKQAVIDELTNIPNRRGMGIAFDRLALLAQAQERTNDRRHNDTTANTPKVNPSSLLLFDLDHFKQINDERGHAGGDAVLKTFAGILERRPLDLPFRLGGEEFALLLPGADETVALHVAESVREQTEDTGLVTVSAGIGIMDMNASLEANMERIDQALYAAKAAGRNQVFSASNLPYIG